MESDFSGNNFSVLQEDDTLMTDPDSAYIVLLADESGVYYTRNIY